MIAELEELKNQLLELKSETYTIGIPKLDKISSVYSMIIRRIYPESERNSYMVGGVAAIYNKTNEEEQEEYLSDIDTYIRKIDTIKKEYELFGFDDFTPLKKKIETTMRLLGFERKSTIETK